MFESLPQALGSLLTPNAILLLILGTAIGTAVAILPGVSAINAMAILLPLTLTMTRDDAMLFLVAIMAATGFAGSMTSILINVPGDGVNAATCLDGYPLARQGRGAEAIAASATASGLGAVIGLGVLVAMLPLMRELILRFGPPEIFALVFVGVSMIAVVSARSPLKGLAMGFVGLTVGLVGPDFTAGGTRFAFGIPYLYEGIPLVPVIIGLFALPEIFALLRSNESISTPAVRMTGAVWTGIRAVLGRPFLLIRSAMIGSFLGLIPAVGGSVASWVSYFAAVRMSPHPEQFGKGSIEGVIAPEAAIDAKEGGSMVPTLAFGIPGSTSTAILLSAFLLHGVSPGTQLFQNDMPLVWLMILGMVFSNVSTSLIGLFGASWMVKLTYVPAAMLFPFVAILGYLGAYADQQAMFSLVLALAVGVLGIVMVRLDYPRPPLLVGMILASLGERNFYLSWQIYEETFAFLLRPITLGILALTILTILGPQLWQWTMEARARAALRAIGSRQAAAAAQEVLGGGQDGADGAERPTIEHVLFPLFLILCAVVLFLEVPGISPVGRIFPSILLIPLLAMLAVLAIRAGDRWRRRPAGAHAGGPASRAERRGHPTWLVAGWLAGFPALMWLIGTLPAIALYLPAFLLTIEGRRPSVPRIGWSIAAAAVTTASVYYLFGEALGIRLMPGLFWG